MGVMISIHKVQLSQNIRASLKLTKLFTLCDCFPSHLNAGNCVWLKWVWEYSKWSQFTRFNCLKISMRHLNWLNFSHCDCFPSHLNAGNCVWLPYSDHAKTTWNIRKWCSTNTVHMCNTFMNLTTYYVQLSLISAAIKWFILPCFVQHEGCSYLKIVACRSRWVCSSSNSCIWLLHTHTFSQYTLY